MSSEANVLQPMEPFAELAHLPASPPPPDPAELVAETIAQFGDDPDFVTALARGLAVMLALSDKKRRMSIAQVSHRTGIPRAAARRSLHTLSKLGFVAADDARRFYLRPRVLSFSHAYLSTSPLAILAQPILDRLGEKLHEACSLGILDGDEIVYIARSASSRIMSPALNVGRRLPAYCTSIGHVMLAHLAGARARRLPGPHAVPSLHRAHARRPPEKLRAVLREVRESGFAFASQQMEARLCTLAVPVKDIGGNFVAGMNVILQGRLVTAGEMAARFAQPLQDAASELGSLLLP